MTGQPVEKVRDRMGVLEIADLLRRLRVEDRRLGELQQFVLKLEAEALTPEEAERLRSCREAYAERDRVLAAVAEDLREKVDTADLEGAVKWSRLVANLKRLVSGGKLVGVTAEMERELEFRRQEGTKRA